MSLDVSSGVRGRVAWWSLAGHRRWRDVPAARRRRRGCSGICGAA